jgi:hypothetical protein
VPHRPRTCLKTLRETSPRARNFKTTHNPKLFVLRREIYHDPDKEIHHDPDKEIHDDPDKEIHHDPDKEIHHDPDKDLITCSVQLR